MDTVEHAAPASILIEWQQRTSHLFNRNAVSIFNRMQASYETLGKGLLMY